MASSVISGIQNDIWNDTEGNYAPGFENFDGFYSRPEPPVFGKELSEDEEPDEKVSYGDLGMQVYDSMLALSMNSTDIDSDNVFVSNNDGPSFRGH